MARRKASGQNYTKHPEHMSRKSLRVLTDLTPCIGKEGPCSPVSRNVRYSQFLIPVCSFFVFLDYIIPPAYGKSYVLIRKDCGAYL